MTDPAQQAAAQQDTRENAEPRRQMPIHKDKLPGRNDPCPCGSGKKFKKLPRQRTRINLYKVDYYNQIKAIHPRRRSTT